MGLAAGTFYFPTSAENMPYAAADAGKTIAQWEVGSLILENFATVDEVKKNIDKIVGPAEVLAVWALPWRRITSCLTPPAKAS